MFTGLIEAVGEVAELKPTPTGFRLRVLTTLAPELGVGDSLAINGVCLTVITATPEEIHADVAPETARVSSLGSLKRGTLVNLERALKPDARLGGHFVQGHVDAVGALAEIRDDGEFQWLTIKFPEDLAPYIVRKGSIAVDGISLTVAGVDERHFDVQIIPHTLQCTNLRAARVDDQVNIEVDIIGKYVVRVAELAGFGVPARGKRGPG